MAMNGRQTLMNMRCICQHDVDIRRGIEVPEGGGEGQATSASSSTPAVFISYASQDAAVAAGLVEALERRGIACWIAPRDVKAGALYADAIVRAISGAKVFVLVLSESAIAYSHVSKPSVQVQGKRACTELTAA
jgi:TIR domain